MADRPNSIFIASDRRRADRDGVAGCAGEAAAGPRPERETFDEPIGMA